MYQHHVESARMTPLLAQLDTSLGDICAAANDSLHGYLARSLLQAITIALQRVLLDGGPYRCALHLSAQLEPHLAWFTLQQLWLLKVQFHMQ